ncbi:unnamed protein product [Nezara viridula]|uniref:Translocator protein n=1 Tax=Nezara viridula TaxID=85310 RepID=A0A9P0HM82_NEZVI|nr:unnamed protein product [Nezara viridula]
MWIAPNYIFQNVWTFLLISMGSASFIVWKSSEKSFLPLLLYCVLLGLTWAWTPIFFSTKSLTSSLTVAAVMIPTADFCVYLFLEVNPVAGFLVAPLPLWLIYIAYLHYTLCYLNQEFVVR